MADEDILARIKSLVEEEHALNSGESVVEDRAARRKEVEEALDQCWDLLRQRQARRDNDQDPAGARARPVSEVESYQQ